MTIQTQTQTIKFLDLQKINQQYKTELLNACEQVINSGWYIRGEQNKNFENRRYQNNNYEKFRRLSRLSILRRCEQRFRCFAFDFSCL